MRYLPILCLLMFSLNGYSNEPWHYASEPTIDSEDFSSHIMDQNVHFYYFTDCAYGDGASVEPFYNLLLEHSDICNIHDLLSKMSDKGVVSLLKNAKSLHSLGDKIRRVHPLRFIGYICSQHDLRKKMRAISESSFKWNQFVSGFGERLEQEIKNGNFHQYLPGFHDSLKHLPVDVNVVDQLMYSHNWDGLVRYFMNM